MCCNDIMCYVEDENDEIVHEHKGSAGHASDGNIIAEEAGGENGNIG